MATLQKIRNRGPLIAIVIGIALLAFLLGDVNQLFSGQGDMNVAVIGGTEVSIQEYQSRYTNYEEGLKLITGETQVRQETQDYIKSQVWDKLIKTYSLSNSFEDLGIDVSDMELAKIISGENIQNGIDPLTRQVFTDPQTGQFNPQYAVNFFTQANQTPEGMQVCSFPGTRT
jgi:peptidyl-prolyl cis-trans isomerase D